MVCQPRLYGLLMRLTYSGRRFLIQHYRRNLVWSPVSMSLSTAATRTR